MTFPIHWRDIPEGIRRLRSGAERALPAALRGGSRRVAQRWDAVAAGAAHWYSIPAVTRRWNRLLTGDPALTFPELVAERYLPDRLDLRGLSLASGNGLHEVAWALTGAPLHLTGVDIAPERVGRAVEEARVRGLEKKLRFVVGDARVMEIEPESLDVVIAHQALHHLAPVAPMVELIERWLKPDGVLVLNDYVGPARFQWRREQLEVINTLLDSIPPDLRRYPDGRLKRRMWRSGWLTVRLNDPSEAAESDRILDNIHSCFRTVVERGYGGTVLHPLLKGIAGNFVTVGSIEAGECEGERAEVLRRCAEAEDRAIASGTLRHDFVAGVYTKR